MRTSDTQSELIKALFAAKGEFPRIAKTRDGQAGNRKFRYAPLDEINDHVDPILRAHGLMITDSTDGHTIVTRLDHVSGEWRESHMPVNSDHANMQSYGIELTYRRRYAKQLILGIVTEEDIDIRAKERKGRDHTEQLNANGTRQGVGVHSGPKDAFENLQPEVQDQFRKAAPQIDAAMPDTNKVRTLIDMALDNWPDEDRSMLKTGLWYLLDSKTRSALRAAK